MPVLFEQHLDASISLCIWKITETEASLYGDLELSEEDLRGIRSLSLAKRRLERLGCRRALANLLKTNKLEISYDRNGAPTLPAGHISFAHSQQFAAAAFAPHHPVGIDIEVMSERIVPLAPKFVNDSERFDYDIDDVADLHYLWSAKEAVFKWAQMPHLEFLHDITVEGNSATIKRGITMKFCHLRKFVIGDLMGALAFY